MAILDESFDDVVPLTEAAQELPGRPHPSTLLRWAKGIRGVKLPDSNGI
ncbi:MAG: DUF1580 domain-containing protein [Planctomycetaceae bacterium]